jgi:hypothetical protein
MYMTNVKVVCDPVFIPNMLNPKHHHLICKVMRMMPSQRDGYMVADKAHVYTASFWGKQAEVAAKVLVKMSNIDLQGYFTCTSWLDDKGKRRPVIDFVVRRLEPREPSKMPLDAFSYSKAACTGKYGEAKVWIKGHGFLG